MCSVCCGCMTCDYLIRRGNIARTTLARQTQITSAKADLTAHPNWDKLDEAERRSILDQFETREFASDPGTPDEAAAFVCTSCQADASTLALQAATIASLLTQAIARLDALDVPRTPESPEQPGPGTSGPISSSAITRSGRPATSTHWPNRSARSCRR